jgi:hypothetical protein
MRQEAGGSIDEKGRDLGTFETEVQGYDEFETFSACSAQSVEQGFHGTASGPALGG